MEMASFDVSCGQHRYKPISLNISGGSAELSCISPASQIVSISPSSEIVPSSCPAPTFCSPFLQLHRRPFLLLCASLSLSLFIVLLALGIYVGLVVSSLQRVSPSLHIHNAALSSLCDSVWSVDVSATVYSSALVPIRIDNGEATATLSMSVGVALLPAMEGGGEGAEECLNNFSQYLLSTAAAPPPSLQWTLSSLADNQSFQLQVSQAVAQIALLDDVTLNRGSTTLAARIAVEPLLLSLFPVLSLMSNMTNALLTSNISLHLPSGCSAMSIDLRATVQLSVSADAHVEVLSIPQSREVRELVDATLVEHSCLLVKGEVACSSTSGTPSSPFSPSLPLTTGSSSSLAVRNVSAVFLPALIRASATAEIGGELRTPDGLTLDRASITFPDTMQWALCFGSDPFASLVLSPSILSLTQSDSDSSFLLLSFNISTSAAVEAGNTEAWQQALQRTIDERALPSLSLLSYTPSVSSTSSCTFSSIFDSRYLGPSALQALISPPAATASPTSPNCSDPSCTPQTESTSSSSLSLDGVRLTDVSYNADSTSLHTLAIDITADIGASTLGINSVLLSGDLPNLNLTLHQSSIPAVSLTLASIPLTAGYYRLTIAVALALMNETAALQSLLPSILAGVTPSFPLPLDLTLQCSGPPSILSSILSGLTFSTDLSSFDGLSHVWSSLLTPTQFWLDSAVPEELILVANPTYAWTNIIRLPSITLPIEMFALPPSCGGECGKEDALGGLSVSITTYSGFPEQTLYVDAMLRLTASNCTLADRLQWEMDGGPQAAVASPCWLPYFAGQYLRNEPFAVPLLLRFEVGAFAVSVPYYSFTDTSLPPMPSLINQAPPSSFGCHTMPDPPPGALAGVLLQNSTGQPELWLPALNLSTPLMLVNLPLSAIWGEAGIVVLTALQPPLWEYSDADGSSYGIWAGAGTGMGNSSAAVGSVNGSVCLLLPSYTAAITLMVADFFPLQLLLQESG